MNTTLINFTTHYTLIHFILRTDILFVCIRVNLMNLIHLTIYIKKIRKKEGISRLIINKKKMFTKKVCRYANKNINNKVKQFHTKIVKICQPK